MTQKTTPEGTVFFCEFCGRDNFRSRQAAAAHEKVCGKNPAVCEQPAPAKEPQKESTPAKDEQNAAANDPFPIPEQSNSGTAKEDGGKHSPPLSTPPSSVKSSRDTAVLSGDDPALPYGLIVIIFVLVGAGIALYAFRGAIVSFWEHLINGDDEIGKPPQPAAV